MVRLLVGRWAAGLLLVLLLGSGLGLGSGVVAAPMAGAAPVLPRTTSWPLAGAVQALRVFDPPAERWGRGHRGVDLRARVGDQVLAAAAGRVTFAARLAGRGVVVVDHGATRTTYEPVLAAVTVGSEVEPGTVIGRIGHGGHCSARCLHWGLIRGDTYLDPLLLAPYEGPVRLLPPDRRRVAEQRATQRATRTAAAAEYTEVSFAGRNSRGDFLHPVPGGVTSPFGMRFHPVLHVWKLHDGTDFGASCGTAIRAPADGRVRSRSYNAGYGNRLMLDHGTVAGQHVVTGFNHAIRYVVGSGTTVRRGQVIGYVGSTGYSTGCHLHLMVWLDGRLRNPMTWFGA